MPLKAIDHVQFAMPPREEARARAFYGRVLGLAEQPKPAHLAKRGGVWFEQGALKIHLGVEEDFRPAKKAHPAFLVEGLQTILEHCRRDGYKVVYDEPLEGYERAYVYDPFGNRLELMEPKPRAR
jgi:catechol 2,3-dioxygenase-like lactoylglutathione lyase family enzyme